MKPTQPISEEEEVLTEDETGITPALEKEVTFPGSGLEAAIREAIDKPVGPIRILNLEGLASISASQRNIPDITGCV